MEICREAWECRPFQALREAVLAGVFAFLYRSSKMRWAQVLGED